MARSVGDAQVTRVAQMILAVALAAAIVVDGDESVCLARTYRPGDLDTYRVQVSPPDQMTPLSNPFQIEVRVKKGPVVQATGSPTPYAKPSTLAQWRPEPNGLLKKLDSAEKDFAFLPFALLTNEATLSPGQMQSVSGGSIKLKDLRDSVALLKLWVPMGNGFVLSEDSDVEVATRRINHARGTIYREIGGRLTPVRAFTIERVRNAPVAPILQPEDPES